MKHQRLFGLLAILALFLVLGCQIANLFGSAPTALPPPSAVVRNTPLPPIAPPPGPTPIPPVAPPPGPTPIPPVQVVGSPTPEQVVQPPAESPPPPAQPPPPQPPPASVPPGCMNPNQSITSPANESTLTGLVEIRGTATRPDLQYWKVEYRAQNSTEYIALSRSEKGVTDDTLARLSTKTLPNGIYFVRLVIVQKDGNFAAPCELRLTIAN